jgi:hypothetical protein
MKYQESAKKLEQIAQGFESSTLALTQIFKELNLIREVDPPSNSITFTKFAGSAAIISELTVALKEAANPDEVRVAIQLGKIGDKVRLALPGGAVLSSEEQSWIEANSDSAPPPNLFYILAQQQLMDNGDAHFTYPEELTTNSFKASLRRNLARELREELGESAANSLELGEFLPGQRITTLSSINLPDFNASTAIADRLEPKGVTRAERTDAAGNKQITLNGIYTKVTEQVAIAHGPLSKITESATNNSEAVGMRVRSIGELLTLSKKTSESPEAFQDFRKRFPESNGEDGIRNPSTTWGLGLLARWLMGKVIEADSTYRG